MVINKIIKNKVITIITFLVIGKKYKQIHKRLISNIRKFFSIIYLENIFRNKHIIKIVRNRVKTEKFN